MIQVALQNFVKAELSCPCCGLFIINHEALTCLQGFRYSLNRKYKKDIRINPTSGTRCTKHNARVGGVENSYHLTGQAFDITSPDINYKQLYSAAIESNLFSTVIGYNKSSFVHVDTRPRKKFAVKAFL